jgi:glycyl-tRNA synthetase
MVHYAQDCWDVECYTSYGWIECVGCADRSTHDLARYSDATGANIKAERKLSETRMEEFLTIVPEYVEIINKTLS